MSNQSKTLLVDVAQHVLAAEKNAVTSHQWADTNIRQAAINSLNLAYTATNNLLDRLDGLQSSPRSVTLLVPFVESFHALTGYILKATKSSDMRLAALSQAADQAVSRWAEIKAQLDDAAEADVDGEIRDVLSDIQQAGEAAQKLIQSSISAGVITGRKLIFANRLRIFVVPRGQISDRVTLSAAGDRELADLTRNILDEPPEAPVPESESSRGADVRGPVSIFGAITWGLTIGLAIWAAVDEKTNTTRSVVQSFTGIAVGAAISTVVDAGAEAAVDSLVAAGYIGETSLVALSAPTGVGLIIGLVVSALIDLFFSLFWSDPVFPPRLMARLTAPLETSLRTSLTTPLTTSLTVSLTHPL